MSSTYTYSGYAPGIAAAALGLGLLYQFSPALRANTSPNITSGKIVLSLVALFTSTGCYLADWSETHVFNPRWPPHAKFHNGQTMSMGLLLGLSTAYFTWRRKPTLELQKADIFVAGLLGSLYWITGLSGGLYPGTLFTDPEFGEGHPQLYGFSVFAAMSWLGYWLEMRRLDGGQA